MINNINLVVDEAENVAFDIDDGNQYNFDFDTKIVTVDADPYTGTYVVTPNNETQTLETATKFLANNVVVNPIPSNYGLITWNGSTLTVS